MNVPCSIVAREHASSFAENHKQRFTARCATLVGCDVCVTSLASQMRRRMRKIKTPGREPWRFSIVSRILFAA